MEPDNEIIAQRITDVVEKMVKSGNGTDLTKAAADIGISLSTLHRWMNGENQPSYVKMVRLARITGRPLDWFISTDEAETEAVA
jgi:transcriptional regulator with XRE-family HTH domain